MDNKIIESMNGIKKLEHPMLEVMKTAYEKARNGKDNGNYKVYSDELGKRDPPHFSATVQKQGNNYSFLEIKNISNGTVFSNTAATNVIASEIELDRFPFEIPVDDAICIVQKITKKGRIEVLKEKDKQPAIANARKSILTEKLTDVPAKVKNEIIQIGRWDLFSNAAKSVISMQWAKKLGNNVMVIANDSAVITKDRVRALVLFVQKEV